MNDASLEQTVVPLDLLREITDGFSEERKIGSGSHGKVYLGVHRDGQKIAVKLIYDMPGVDDKQFQNEFKNLTRLRHQNIVRLVGYCHDIQEVQVKHEGKLVLAEKTHRALCLEYMSNGSLENYLSDECDKYNWRTGYGIIKGICQGLKYLHNEIKPPIYHLDLKPANVLLDENMVPRIADFGISRLFGDELTRATISSLGTVGYLPPEYIRNNLISSKFDIFSLGVVIIKIMAGQSGYFNITDMSSQEFANLVQEKWTNRLHETSDLTKASSEQVKICIEIGLSCVQEDRHKRPAIQDIVDRLNETETECTHAARKNRLLFYQDSLSDTTQRGNIYSSNHQQATGGCYKLMNFGGVEELACSKIWRCSAPKKCKKFAWLLVKHRAKVRVVLKKQGIVNNDKCPFGCCAPETVSHLALECSRTKHIWGLLGVSFSDVNQPAGIFTDGMRFISEDKIKAWELVAIAVVWSVWLARNRRVFDGVTVPPDVVAKQCATMVKLWANRAKKEELMAVRKWIAGWSS